MHALVASRIDFCNSILYRPVASVHLRPLQSAQNAAARLVLKLSKFDRDAVSTTICNELHWLPVHKRIVYRNYASLCSNINTSRPQHTCRHFVRRSQLSQSVVSCGQQPKATSIIREHELSHTAHGHLVTENCWLHAISETVPSSIFSEKSVCWDCDAV